MSTAHEKVFLARQPIFDEHRQVFGYELLFRAPDGEGANRAVLDVETATVITEAVLAFGLDTITHGRPTFVKVSRGVLLAGLPGALPPDKVVIELPGDIDASPDVLDACGALRKKGFKIALDQFIPNTENAALLPYSNFLKTDLHDLDLFLQGRDASSMPPQQVIVTHVETPADFKMAADKGVRTFQGDFIGKPVLRTTKDIPANRLTYFRLFQALQNPDLSPRELEDLIKPDTALVYRVLRAVNSAAFAQHARVESLRQALVLLGVGTVRQWAALWTMSAFAKGAPDELVTTATIRGRACEIVASADDTGELGDGFLLGVCSLLDAILEMPMAHVLDHLPLPEATDAALRGENNKSRRLLDAVIAYENGGWDRCMNLTQDAGMERLAVPFAYGKSLQWYRQFKQLSEGGAPHGNAKPAGATVLAIS